MSDLRRQKKNGNQPKNKKDKKKFSPEIIIYIALAVIIIGVLVAVPILIGSVSGAANTTPIVTPDCCE